MHFKTSFQLKITEHGRTSCTDLRRSQFLSPPSSARSDHASTPSDHDAGSPSMPTGVEVAPASPQGTSLFILKPRISKMSARPRVAVRMLGKCPALRIQCKGFWAKFYTLDSAFYALPRVTLGTMMVPKLSQLLLVNKPFPKTSSFECTRSLPLRPAGHHNLQGEPKTTGVGQTTHRSKGFDFLKCSIIWYSGDAHPWYSGIPEIC